MEFIISLRNNRPKLKVAIFDFDGTISTLRQGWEKVMEPLMLEAIAGMTPMDAELINEVREYIDQSTGIQTYYQMEWLAEAVERHGRNLGALRDAWWYKDEYNKRLMEPVEERKKTILSGEKPRTDYLIKGSEDFIRALVDRGIEIYVASGTDDSDVKKEVEVLGLKKYFKEIMGAPVGRADCSKEAVLRKLVGENRFRGPELVVIGDGKVEIALGREVEAVTLGIASDEVKLCGINPTKRTKLIKAGAHAITGDFEKKDEVLEWLGL